MSAARTTTSFAILRRMFLQARRYWPHLGAILVLGLLSTPLALLTPLPLKIVIDSVLGSHPLPGFIAAVLPAPVESSSALLVIAGALLVGVAFLTYAASLGSWVLQTHASEGMLLDFRTRLFSHVQQLSLAYHDAKGSADSAFRIQYDAPSVQQLTIHGVIPVVTATVTLVGLLIATFSLDVQLALIALSICPLLYLLTRHFAARLRKRWKDVKKLESSANAVVHETLGSMRVVKSFGREEHEKARFLGRATQRRQQLLRVAVLQGLFDLGVGLTIAAGTAGILIFGARHVQSGSLTIGELTLILAYVAAVYEPLRTVSKRLADLQAGLASAERAFALLDEVPAVVEKPDAIPVERAAGHVAFQDASFTYDGQRDVVRNATFDVPAGMRVGIKGRTGAGKSTIVSLLTRFYDVQEGRILLDGIDLRDYRIADLRNQFGIVLQDAVLFSTSISENIAYGRPDVSDAQIIEAAKLADAHDFISALPEGYDTVVGERGMRLSGGERQRISLARAFLKDAPILILDEPTSAVDLRTEASIMGALERLMVGRTTFMIAHRTSTLATCDLVLEIEDGRVIHQERSARLLATAAG